MSDYPAPFPLVKTIKPAKYEKGDVILTVEELSQERCVYWWAKPKPVAFIINMQARLVLDLVRRGAFRKMRRTDAV